jgi:hypothetical protein
LKVLNIQKQNLIEMTERLRQWFTDLGSVDPTQPASAKRYARYNGQYGGNIDPKGQGEVGKTYVVQIKTALKLDAPNPPFQDPESPDDEVVPSFVLENAGTLRLRKWFTILESVDPEDPQSIYRYARYNGVFNRKSDPKGEGEIGKVYVVKLSDVMDGSMLEAPNPPFQDPE